ncbi:MAG: hypothetical protein ACXQS8_04690 [Candidatus Helarchaeales archaeon]
MKEYSMKEKFEASKESLLLNHVIALKFLVEKQDEETALEYCKKMASWSADYRLGSFKKALVKSVGKISIKKLASTLMTRVLEGMQYILPVSHVSINASDQNITITIENCPLKKEMKKLIKKFNAPFEQAFYCKAWCGSLFKEYLTNIAGLETRHELNEKGCSIVGTSR